MGDVKKSAGYLWWAQGPVAPRDDGPSDEDKDTTGLLFCCLRHESIEIDAIPSFLLLSHLMHTMIDASASLGGRMLVSIESADQLGRMVRATRRTQKLRLDDTAGTVGVEHVFVRDVGYGKPTVRLGCVLQLLAAIWN